MTRIEIGEDIAVTRDGERVEMPKSRKARALLAYLVLTDKPVHRGRLSEMFWDQASDPRGGLRWALTRLRRVLGEDEKWLVADASNVRFDCPAEALCIERGHADRLLLATESGEHDDYAAWLVSMRDEVAETESSTSVEQTRHLSLLPHQTIRYTTAPDGTRIAYAAMGEGKPVMKAANWLTHLDAELEIPAWSGFTTELARSFRLYRYDERGNGLSDWNVDDLSFEAFVSDLECVTDALGLERFPLIGISQGASVSIEYAARHPEKVTGLVLIGGYPAGWRHHSDPDIVVRRAAEMTLVEHGWGDNSPAYRQIFSHTFFPDADSEIIDKFNEFQRMTTSPRNAARFIDTFGDIDVRERLSDITAPTLVLHSRDDQRIASSVGARLAASIPNAQLLTLASNNHLPRPGEPAFPVMMAEVERFLKALPS
ncbi:MAG: alpha/beta fold hydrolase [Parvularcula sp.]|jgi:pimeloyl-ACP methyl ester carboxylesterase|nr:alpha/beta fold hydrolase [Parvularcula sp.]